MWGREGMGWGGGFIAVDLGRLPSGPRTRGAFGEGSWEGKVAGYVGARVGHVAGGSARAVVVRGVWSLVGRRGVEGGAAGGGRLCLAFWDARASSCDCDGKRRGAPAAGGRRPEAWPARGDRWSLRSGPQRPAVSAGVCGG